jgi:hypothetical protein
MYLFKVARIEDEFAQTESVTSEVGRLDPRSGGSRTGCQVGVAQFQTRDQNLDAYRLFAFRR